MRAGNLQQQLHETVEGLAAAEPLHRERDRAAGRAGTDAWTRVDRRGRRAARAKRTTAARASRAIASRGGLRQRDQRPASQGRRQHGTMRTEPQAARRGRGAQTRSSSRSVEFTAPRRHSSNSDVDSQQAALQGTARRAGLLPAQSAAAHRTTESIAAAPQWRHRAVGRAPRARSTIRGRQRRESSSCCSKRARDASGPLLESTASWPTWCTSIWSPLRWWKSRSASWRSAS